MTDPASTPVAELLVIRNPATNETLAEMPADSGATLQEKYARATAAQPAWAAQPIDARLAIVQRFRSLVEREQASLARTTSEETGKPITQSHNELRGFLGRIDYFLRETPAVVAPQTVHEEAGLREALTWEPLGVIGNISAWNYPYFVGGNVFVPALLCGNAVLYKPSELATRTGLALAGLLHEAGVPEDVFLPVIGAGTIGAALVGLPLGGIFFTGSHATGQRVALAAARHLSRVQLELGGKDPVYVTDDVDLDAAASATAEGVFYNGGQSCCAIERLYVHAVIYDRFVEAFVRAATEWRAGDPLDPATTLGPLTRAAQLDVLDEQIRDAVARGAVLRTGGARLSGSGSYFAPTVLTDVTPDMALMQEESFGPIIGIARVRDDAEARALMADTRYGLTAGIYCRSFERARPILESLPVGTAYWNCCDRVSPRLPWSGRKDSGLGVTLGRPGIQAFVQPKAWHLRGA